jgi:hypothetical protein
MTPSAEVTVGSQIPVQLLPAHETALARCGTKRKKFGAVVIFLFCFPLR